MANSPFVDVTMAAALIKATMPQQYMDLCGSIKALEAQAVAEMASADSATDVYRAQGKFKFAQLLRKHLTECSELRETYTRRDTHARSAG